ncbi:MAG: TetR/AcrR family transcriptional regulator [Solirubrobacteraceae bacterium]|nr:TetR/AcrR family transcriptional regulator [Solirubrobacteraceae bacterium]
MIERVETPSTALPAASGAGRPARSADRSGSARTYTGARPGGRSERVREAILKATTEELLSVGYAELTLSSVAARAGLALSTVRRRWGSKAALAAATVTEMTAGAVPVPDTGTLEGDLRAMTQSVFDYASQADVITMIRTTLALPEDELTDVRTQHWLQRGIIAHQVTQRAIERGEIPPSRNSGRLVEMAVARMWMRALLTGRPFEQHELEGFVQDALAAARAGGRLTP